MTPLAVIVYILFCLLTAVFGIERRLGFWGTFIISLFITPPVMLLVLLFTAERAKKRPPRAIERRAEPRCKSGLRAHVSYGSLAPSCPEIHTFADFRCTPKADNRLHRSETTRCAITGREQMQRRHHSYSISSPSLA